MAGRRREDAGPEGAQPAGPRQQIQAYGGGAFRVSGIRYQGSILVLAERTQGWAATSIETMSAASLAPLIEEARQAGALVVIGCGERFAPMPRALRSELAAAGIDAEWMDTRAACRTFSVLAGEGRIVRAALLAVG